MKTAIRAVSVIFTLTVYFVCAPFGYAFFYCWGLVPTRTPERRARVFQRAIRWGFGTLHRWSTATRLMDCELADIEDRRDGKPCVVVANHPTLMDTTALIGACEGLVTIVKPSIYRAWWVRPFLRGAYFIEGPDGNPDSIKATLDVAAERLAAGFSVLIFPEGTRTPGSSLLPFGRLGFELACRADVPVCPYAITCEPRWLSKDHPLLDFSPEHPKLRLKALEPVHPSTVNSCSRTLRQLVRDRVEESLGLSGSTPDTLKENQYVGYPGTQNQRSHRRVVDARGH